MKFMRRYSQILILPLVGIFALWLSGTQMVQSQPTIKIAVVNPDHYRIVKFAYMHGGIDKENDYRSIAMGEAEDRGQFHEICNGGWTNPDCWTGVGSQPDFLGTLLSNAGYQIDYFTSDTFPNITPSDYQLVVVQDPLTDHLRSFPKSSDINLPDLLEKVTQQLVDRLISYFNIGGRLLLVGDAVRLLEDSPDPTEPRLNFGKTIQTYNNAHTLSDPHPNLPTNWLFIRGNPFCGVDRSGSGTYITENSTLLPPATKIADLSFFDGNDIPKALIWSDTVYYPSDGTSLLDVRVQGSGEYVLRGDICSPLVYTVTVDDVLPHFMGYTTYNDRRIFYVGSDTFFNYEVIDHDGAWHAGQFQRMSYTTTTEGQQAFLNLVQMALSSDLMAYYKFDEGTGTIVLDSSGNGNHGTIMNGASYVTGVSGTALQFDGIDDFIEVPDDPSLKPENITIEFWVNPAITLDDSITQVVPFLSKNNDDRTCCADGYDVFYHPIFNTPHAYLGFGLAKAPNERVPIPFFTALPANTWYHIAATYDGSTMKLYLKGVEVSSSPEVFSIFYGTDKLWIGKAVQALFGGTLFFQGKMDEVRIYNRALSSAEILARCQESAPPDVVCGSMFASGDVVINEVAWMGTQASSADEWIELYNNTDNPIDLTGWKILEVDETGTETLIEPLSGTIGAHSYYLIERTADDTVSDIPADQPPSSWGGYGLSNDGEHLILKDDLGKVIDEIDASGGWFAGTASPDYRSMERIDPTASGSDPNNWATNDPNIARNGLDADDPPNPINGTPKARNSATNSPPTADAGLDQIVNVGDTVQLDGSGSSDPDGDPLSYSWSFISKPVGSVAVLSGADIVISNDFESYDVGTFPSAGGWILWFSGAGSSEQFVTDAVSVSPSKSFRMKGAWGWAANAARYFTATSNMIGYETYVRVEQATGVYYSAAIGFSKRTSATTSNWYAAVWFEQDSTIRSGGQVLQTYEANRWYRIKVVLDKATNTYDVWIDNQLKGDDLQTQNSHEIEAFSLAAEWSGVTVYYDDVKVFQIVADPNIVNPTFVADVAGDYVLELTVDDGRGGTDSDQVMITAVANQVPTCNNINATTDEDSFIDINLSLHCTDPDGDPLTGSFLSDPPNGTAQFLSPTIRYTPDPNFYGADSFTYRVTDGQAESNTATVNVTINPVNDPPVADDQSVSTSEDTAVNITLNGSDIDGDPLTFSTVTNPGNGTLSGTPPNVTYMPNPDFNGTDSFTFQVNDGQGGTDTGTVSITVTPVNDAPVCNDINVSTDEDMPVDIPVDCSDVEGDVLTGSFLSDPPHGTAQFLSPIIRYTPDPNFYGADSFTYRVTDGELESNTATVNVTINEVNDPPVADFSYFPEKPTTLDTIQFTDQSTDLDGNIVSWSWDFGDGNFSTQQNPIHRYDDDGTYTVSLTVTDDERAPNTTTKQVVVANIAPTAAFSFSPVNPTTWDSVQFTDQSTDPDDPIQLWHWDFGDGNTSTQQNPAHRYDNPGTYTVSLTVTDDDEDSAIATQQLEVSLKQGDINNDRAIDLKDAMLAAEFALGLQTPTAFQQEAADVTPPLGVIDVRDAVRIAEVALGIRNGFSLPSPGAGAPISTSSHSTPAKLHLESLVLSVGGRGVLRILADKIAGLQAGPVGGLKFDPKVIRVRSIRGVGHVLLASKIDNKAGKAVFLFVSVRGTKKVKEGAIIELEIEAVGHAGESTFLELEVDMAIDLKGQGVKPMTINGSVTLSEPAELRVKEVRSTPNPASSAVRFIVIGEGIKEIQVQIYDLSGRMVFMSGWVENGFVWHLQNNDGKRLANGVYLYIVTVRGFYGEVISKVGKLVILR